MYVSDKPQIIEPEQLNNAIELGSAFRILPGNNIILAGGRGDLFGSANLYAPEVVYVSEDDPYTLQDAEGWRGLRGYTGQYGYDGPIMHPSERLAGHLAKDIVETPGVYVLVIVETGGDGDDDTPAGWAVLKLIDDSMSKF